MVPVMFYYSRRGQMCDLEAVLHYVILLQILIDDCMCWFILMYRAGPETHHLMMDRAWMSPILLMRQHCAASLSSSSGFIGLYGRTIETPGHIDMPN
jgi:hypothetical protein